MTRNEAYLTVVEGWLRDNRGIVFTEGAVDDLCDRIAPVLADRDEWKQAAGVEAGLRREFLAEIGRLRAFEWAWWQLSLELRKDMANDCPSEFTMALRRALEDKP